jgi:site-specific recombinase XerD
VVDVGAISSRACAPRASRSCVEAAGIEAFTWHCLRHTFASRLVKSGADLRTVAELLRHRTLAMVMRYAHLAADFRMDAVQRMQKKFELKKRSKSAKSGIKSGTVGSGDRTPVH